MQPPGVSPDPLLGCLLDGRYRIQDKLGEGGMGTVYRATHVLMGKDCAVKVLQGPTAAGELAGKRFQREAHSASLLDHEHCIRVTDFGVTAEVMYLVMELLEGRTLADELAARGALPAARALAIAREVAAALAHAHEHGVIHRDLKPDNIFLCARGDRVKVLDFGLAKLVQPEAGMPGSFSEPGKILGTPEYLSPEQADGRPLDARSDLYSFGVVLYQMLTGMLPFQGPNYLAVVSQHLAEIPVSPAERRPDLALPPALVELTLRCLEKDPARRPPSAAELGRDLAAIAIAPRVSAQVASRPTVELESAEAVPPAPAPIRSPRWPLYLVLSVPLLAAAAVVVAFTRGPTNAATDASPPVSASAPVPAAVPVPAPVPVPVPVPVPAAASAASRGAVDSGAEHAGSDAAMAPALAPSPPALPPGPTAADHLRKAARYRRAGNRIKELYYLQQAVRLDPRNHEALFRLGAALLEEGQHDLGCEKLQKAGDIANSIIKSSGCQAPARH